MEHMLSIVNIRGHAAVVGNPYRNPNIAEHDRTEKSGLAPTQNVKYFRTKNENRKSGNVNRFALLIISKLNLKTQHQRTFWHTCTSYERVCIFVTATPHGHLMTSPRSSLLGQAACESGPFGSANILHTGGRSEVPCNTARWTSLLAAEMMHA